MGTDDHSCDTPSNSLQITWQESSDCGAEVIEVKLTLYQCSPTLALSKNLIIYYCSSGSGIMAVERRYSHTANVLDSSSNRSGDFAGSIRFVWRMFLQSFSLAASSPRVLGKLGFWSGQRALMKDSLYCAFNRAGLLG